MSTYRRMQSFIVTMLIGAFLAASCGQSAPAVTATTDPAHGHAFAPTQETSTPSPAEQAPAPSPTLTDWSNVLEMPIPRFEANVVALDGYVYVAGGITARNSLKSFVRFDPATNIWEELADMPDFRNHQGPDMPTGRSGMAFAIINGQLHAIAGEDLDRNLVYMKHEVFDFSSQTWTQLHDIPRPLNAPVAAALDGYISLMGGGSVSGNPYKDVWRFTP
jgi:murein DD-endopeptidase MepM/ murein hydrolase activator NlpD